MANSGQQAQSKFGIRMLIKQRCPRCKGNMLLELDPEVNYYESCLNCGYVIYPGRPALRWNRHEEFWNSREN